MRTSLNSRLTRGLLGVATMLCMTLVGCDTGFGTTVTTTVTGSGTGVGRVSSPNSVVGIDCVVGDNVPDGGTGMCTNTFDDAGLGGTFRLQATPNPGSVFVEWSGCTEEFNSECVLTFTPGDETAEFNVSAVFDLDPENACNAQFDSSNGYILCEETATSCSFYTVLNDVNSCTSVCESFGSTCLASTGDTDDTCVRGDAGECDDVVGDRICTCSL